MRRIVREAAVDDAGEGSRWLEIQVDPTSYAPFVGGITPALEIILDEARSVSEEPSACAPGLPEHQSFATRRCVPLIALFGRCRGSAGPCRRSVSAGLRPSRLSA